MKALFFTDALKCKKILQRLLLYNHFKIIKKSVQNTHFFFDVNIDCCHIKHLLLLKSLVVSANLIYFFIYYYFL